MILQTQNLGRVEIYGSLILCQNADDRIIISIFDDMLFTLSLAMPIANVRENGHW